MPSRSPLKYREQIIAPDVADALELLVSSDPAGPDLPKAYRRINVVDKLIQIAHTEDDGTIAEITPIARRSLGDVFFNRLSNTGVFQAGYKRYEKRSENPVVPVTEFFFRIVFGNGDVSDSLDAMSDHEIKLSMPKRPHTAREEDGITPILDTEGEEVVAGDVAGVVIFPPGTQAKLLRAWLERRAHVTTGLMTTTIDAIEHARPDTKSVADLRETARPIAGAMHRALPRRKPPSGE
jgi:hypothetical protein